MSEANNSKEYLPTRRSLLSRLRNWDDQESWQDFFNTYWELIYGVAVKAGLTDAEAQDVVQDTIISVAKNLRGFRYRASGSFKAWLLGATRWRIVDQLRKRMPVQRGRAGALDRSPRTATIEKVPCPSGYDLEASWDEEWNVHFQSVALERVKAKINTRHYQIFHLNVVKEWPAQRVAATLGVSTAQVYQVKSRVVRMIRSELSRLEKKAS